MKFKITKGTNIRQVAEEMAAGIVKELVSGLEKETKDLDKDSIVEATVNVDVSIESKPK